MPKLPQFWSLPVCKKKMTGVLNTDTSWLGCITIKMRDMGTAMNRYLQVFVLCLALLSLTLLAGSALAQETSLPDRPARITERHTPVAVEHEGSDSIGARLSTRIKELLNSSNLFVLEEGDTPKFRILLSTVPEFSDRPGVGSAYSITWVFSLSEATLRHYLAREVGVLTPEDVNNIATKVVERTDGMAVRYGYLFPERSNQ